MISASTLRGTHIRNSILPTHLSEEVEQWPHWTGPLALSHNTNLWVSSLSVFSDNFEQGLADLLQLDNKSQLSAVSPSSTLVDAMSCILDLWAAALVAIVGNEGLLAHNSIIE